MRIEGDANRLHPALASFLDHRGKNLPVPAVDSVEVADCGDARTKVRRHFFQAAIDGDHARRSSLVARCRRTGNSRPSQAMRTFGGSMRLVSSWPSSCAM